MKDIRLAFNMDTGRPFHGAKLIFERAKGRHYIALTVDVKCKWVEEKKQSERVIALDPGVRTFMTGYCPDGEIIEAGAGATKRLNQLDMGRRALDGRILKKTTKHAQRLRFRKARRRITDRITNIVDELHWKTCRYLVDNFDVILLPEFAVQQMIETKSKRRSLGVSVVKEMVSLRHYRFRQRLLDKARCAGVTVIIVDEAYTSKTCGVCGVQRKSFSSKLFKCGKCGLALDRDVHAARNILIRAVTESSVAH